MFTASGDIRPARRGPKPETCLDCRSRPWRLARRNNVRSDPPRLQERETVEVRLYPIDKAFNTRVRAHTWHRVRHCTIRRLYLSELVFPVCVQRSCVLWDVWLLDSGTILSERLRLSFVWCRSVASAQPELLWCHISHSVCTFFELQKGGGLLFQTEIMWFVWDKLLWQAAEWC